MSNYLDRCLGDEVLNSIDPERRYRDESDVIGSIENTPNGENTALRIGTKKADGEVWFSGKAHVVLSPGERDHLIDTLTRQRDEQQAAKAADAAEPAEQTFEERLAAVRARARYMGVNTIDLTDLFTVEIGGQAEDVVITHETAEYLHQQLSDLLGK